MNRRKYMTLITISTLTLCFIVFTSLEIANVFKSTEEMPNTAPVITDMVFEEEDDNLRETVMYYTDSNDFLVPVMRKIPWPEDRTIARATINNIIDTEANRASVNDISLSPALPAGTTLLGLNVKDGVCYANFSSEILNYQNEKQEKVIVDALVYTLTEFDAINSVKLKIDGKNIDKLSFGTDVSQPIHRPDINYLGMDVNSNSKALVYYSSTENGITNYVVPVTVEISKEEGVSIDDVAILLNEPPSEGLVSVLPEDVVVQDAQYIDGTVYVDVISQNDIQLSDDAIKSVYLTMVGFVGAEALNEVVITSNGESIEVFSSDGTGAVSVFANYVY